MFLGSLIMFDLLLKLFYNVNGDFYIMKFIVNIKDFGYFYYGLEYWIKIEKQILKVVIQLINWFYSVNEFMGVKVMS